MSECPSDRQLLEYRNHVLGPAEREAVVMHLDQCAHCRARLEQAVATDGRRDEPIVPRPVPPEPPSSPPASDGLPAEVPTLVLGPDRLPRPQMSLAPCLPDIPGYEVLGEIGRGGMGVVYKARHRQLNRLVAIKMILAGGLSDPRTVQRFFFEAEITARIQHPQVVQVYEVGTYEPPGGGPVPYLVMELLEGGTLSRWLREVRLSPRRAAELVEGLARAVHAAHLQGIVHRDLKPANILFPTDAGATGDKDGLPVRQAKITDFGLARYALAGHQLTRTDQVVGTPHYMAPEQAVPGQPVGPAADVYSLGAILFECLAGRPLYTGTDSLQVLLQLVSQPAPDLRSVRPGLPRDLVAIVRRCLMKDPRQRYASAQDLADDLRNYLECRPVQARPLLPCERCLMWVRRNPVVAGLSAALLATVFVGMAVIERLWWEAEQSAREERLAREMARRSEERAVAEAENVRRQKQLADRRQAELEFERGLSLCESGQVRDGLRLFLRAVELAEATGLGELAYAARVNLAAWHRLLPPPQRFLRHPDQVFAVAFHPDGRRVLTAGANASLTLWDAISGEKLLEYSKPLPIPQGLARLGIKNYTYWTVAVSADGRSVATGGSDGKISIWDVDKPKPRLTFSAARKPGDNIWSVAFAPDGSLWAVNGGSGACNWDVSGSQARLLTTLDPRQQPGSEVPSAAKNDVLRLVVSSDGQWLYTANKAGFVAEWQLARRSLTRFWQLPGWVQSLDVTPDRGLLAATGPFGSVYTIPLVGDEPVRGFGLSGAYGQALAFASDTRVLVVCDGDGLMRLWHRDTAQTIGEPIHFSGHLAALRFRPGSNEYAAAAGNCLVIGQLPPLGYRVVRASRNRRLQDMSLAPDGHTLAVASEQDVEVFDLQEGRRLACYPYRGRPILRAVCYSPTPDRGQLYLGHRNGFDCFDLQTGQPGAVDQGEGLDRVTRLAYVEGSGLIALGQYVVGRFDPVTLERLAVGKPAPDIPPGTDLSVLAVRPDGGELLIGYGDQVGFLDPKTLAVCRPGWSVGNTILDAEYTPDGRYVLVGRCDNQAELLDATTGRPVIPALRHNRAVTAVAVSPCGRLLVTASRAGRARFWDASSGLQLGPPLQHPAPITQVLFVPRLSRVVAGDVSGAVLLADLPPPAPEGDVGELGRRYVPTAE